jgi:hypothetical protein
MQLSRTDFERMTWGEFYCRWAGYRRKAESELARTRLVMYAIFQKGNKRKLKPQDIFPLEIDTKKVEAKGIKLMDAAEFQRLKERYSKWQSTN